MSAISPEHAKSEVPEETEPRLEPPQPPSEQKASRTKNPALARFVFMWDGWRSIEVDDGFVLA
jgi:hypothetical protein